MLYYVTSCVAASRSRSQNDGHIYRTVRLEKYIMSMKNKSNLHPAWRASSFQIDVLIGNGTFYCSECVWPFRTLPNKTRLFSWRPLCRHFRCIFFSENATFSEIKSTVHVAEPLGRNCVTILQMSWWLFIFNLHCGSLFGSICLMKQHIDQIYNFPDVDKKAVLFYEDMHYLKHPRKEPGTRSEKQLNN